MTQTFMKHKKYFLCSNKKCVEASAYLFQDQEYSEKHFLHECNPVKLDEIYQKYKEITEDQYKINLEMIRTEIVKAMELLILKMFDKTSKIFTILKNQIFASKSPTSFAYQEISSFLKGDYKPLEGFVKKTYEIVNMKYRPIYFKLQQQISKLLEIIDQSVVNQQISSHLKEEEISDDSFSQLELPEFQEKEKKTKKIKKMQKRVDILFAKKRKNETTGCSSSAFLEPLQQQILQKETLKLDRQDDLRKSRGLNKIKRIVVNNSKIKQYRIRELLVKTPQIKEIVFNSRNQVPRYFYSTMPVHIANNLTKIYECWDEDHYFRERQAQIYYPRDTADENQYKHSHIELKLWQRLQNLRTLWIANKDDFAMAKGQSHTYKRLEYLKIQPCQCCPSDDPSEIIQRFGNLNHLQVLILRKLNFNDSLIKELIECLKKNPLRVVIFSFFTIKQSLIDNFNLANLTNLCLQSQTKPYCFEEIDLSSIFRFQQLKYLSLVRIIFAKDRKNARKVLQNLNQLPNLSYLNLYHSYPVFSQIFDFLHPNVQKSLNSLNLGETHIDNSCLEKLAKLESLEELNLDKTQVDLPNLTVYRKEPYLKLKRLSLSGCDGFDEKTLQHDSILPKKIATVTSTTLLVINQIYPNLQYINIAKCSKDFSDFNWAEMKSLVCITTSKNTLNQWRNLFKQLGIQIFEL